MGSVNKQTINSWEVLVVASYIGGIVRNDLQSPCAEGLRIRAKSLIMGGKGYTWFHIRLNKILKTHFDLGGEHEPEWDWAHAMWDDERLKGWKAAILEGHQGRRSDTAPLLLLAAQWNHVSFNFICRYEARLDNYKAQKSIVNFYTDQFLQEGTSAEASTNAIRTGYIHTDVSTSAVLGGEGVIEAALLDHDRGLGK